MHLGPLGVLLGSLLVQVACGEDVGFEVQYESSIAPFESRDAAASSSASRRMRSLVGGSFLQPSVGQYEMGDMTFASSLDAFGKIHRFDFNLAAEGGSDVEVRGRGRMLNSRFYEESVGDGHVAPGLLFAETTPPRKCPLYNPMCNMLGAANDNVFVNTVRVGGRTFCVTDSATWVELDTGSLNLTGKLEWKSGFAPPATQAATGSAHPLPLSTGVVVDYESEVSVLDGAVHLHVYGVNASDPEKRVSLARVRPRDYLPASSELQWLPYVHSFGLTDAGIVLPLSPLHVDVLPMMTSGLMEPNFKHVPDLGNSSVVLVAALDGAGDVAVFRTERPLYFLHTLNTFVEGDWTYSDMTVCETDMFQGPNIKLDVLRNKTARDAYVGDPNKVMRVDRFALNARTGELKQTPLSDPNVSTDFAKINWNYHAVRHCFYWGVVWGYDRTSYGSMALVKQDVCADDAKHWHRPGWFPSEPTFVPDAPAGDEDAGLLVFVALNGRDKVSSLVVADAKTMDTVYELALPEAIPFATHGQFNWPG